jgi:hypothetical protein
MEATTKNLKKGFYFETTKESAIVFANGFYFGKKENAIDTTHVLNTINADWYTGKMEGSHFSKDFYCNDAILVN